MGQKHNGLITINCFLRGKLDSILKGNGIIDLPFMMGMTDRGYTSKSDSYRRR